ncbi:MAG: superoxide dismutase [Ni] [Planctomycetota bacterium]
MNTTFFKLSLLALIALTSAGYAIAMEMGSVDVPLSPNTEPTVAKAPTVSAPAPHCQVPCGIYTDQLRFEQMLEDTKTIAKSITTLNEFADGLAGAPPTAKDLNQLSRWVTTKETHATNIQNIIADYFLTQRIKEANKEYTNQLITSHKVMVAAMKCKQDAAPATAETLKKAILDLYRAYEGKEPQFDHKEK